jgi:hypothetical protein
MLIDFLLIQLFRSIISKLFRQGFFELNIVFGMVYSGLRQLISKIHMQFILFKKKICLAHRPLASKGLKV